MIRENERLAMNYRDSELWQGDFPTCYGNVDNGRCSKCGKVFNQEIRLSVNISNAHGTEHYDYHKECIVHALNNASEMEGLNFNAKNVF